MGFPTAEIHNHIRGLSPYPAAFSTLKDEAGRTFDVKILTSAVSDDAPGGLAPGETEVRGRRLFAGTSDGAIEILELQPSGKKRMDASSFLLGYHPARFLCSIKNGISRIIPVTQPTADAVSLWMYLRPAA